jgi:hypothetical protein
VVNLVSAKDKERWKNDKYKLWALDSAEEVIRKKGHVGHMRNPT